MNEEVKLEAPKSVRSIWPAVVIGVFAASALVVAGNYSEISGRFPTLVAGTLIVLALIDLYSRIDLPGRKVINSFWGSGFDRREMTHNPNLREELSLFAWVGVAFLGMAFLGILAAAPLFAFLFVWLRSRRTFLQAAAAGVTVFVFEYGVFEWALNYDLYRGLIFNGEGFSAW